MGVGLIGLGNMGLPLADNLRRAGHELRALAAGLEREPLAAAAGAR